MRYPNYSSRDLIGTFWESFETNMADGLVEELCMYMESDRELEEYGWIGETPAMREWVGERRRTSPESFNFLLRNKKYETGIDVLVDDIRRDKTSQIRMRIAQLADVAAEHPQELLTQVMLDGESQTCYDGQNFYDTDHEEGQSGVQANKIQVDISALTVVNHGSTTSPSSEEMAEAIHEGIMQFFKMKNDAGRPANGSAKKFVVVVPATGIAKAAQSAVTTDKFDNGKDNALKKAGYEISVKVDPALTWTTKFTVNRVDGRTKPFIHQEEVPTEMKALAEDSQLEILEDKHFYGVKAIRTIGFGDYKKSVMVELT
jgi:phage major head subunit gpT-like protein